MRSFNQNKQSFQMKFENDTSSCDVLLDYCYCDKCKNQEGHLVCLFPGNTMANI